MPSKDLAVSEITIKIDGAAQTVEFLQDVVEVVVQTDIHLPSMFSIEMFDEIDFDTSKGKWVDAASLDIGKAVEIGITAPSQGDAQGAKGVLIKGEITALEPEFTEEGRVRLLIRGYDKSHRLHRGKKTRTFLNQTDSDIVKKIAGEAGLSAEADATSVKYEYVIQSNQTNMEFLKERAERIGYRVFADGPKLLFQKGADTRGDGPELNWGTTLRSFQPRLTAVHQADSVTVMGWDSKTKKPIEGTKAPAKPANQGGITKKGGDVAKSAFGGSAVAVVMNEPVINVSEANAMAEALGDAISNEFLQAEGVCFGDPRVQAGKVVNIKGVGKRFSGKYLVTAAEHVYQGGRYETRFQITGKNPYTLTRLLNDGDHAHEARLNGVVIGVVTNLNDPDNLGRVKVKFPWMPKDQGKEIESDWVRVVTPMAGAQRGALFLPEVNDEVLLAFEHGDPNNAYMLGGLWNNTDKPPAPNNQATKDGKVIQRIIKTRAGHTLTLDDSDDKPKIEIVDKTGKNKITLDSKENTLTISTEKDITITAKGDMSLKSTGDLTLEGKNFNVKAQQNVALKATQNCTVEATQNAEIKGLQIAVKGQTGVEASAGAGKVVIGPATVNINNGALEVM
jgi:uncharacterized protein involved in type VI secretion and phage assembly